MNLVARNYVAYLRTVTDAELQDVYKQPNDRDTDALIKAEASHRLIELPQLGTFRARPPADVSAPYSLGSLGLLPRE